MRKQFTFMLLAAALLVSVPSWAYMIEGEPHNFTEYNFPNISGFGNSNDFGTLCFPGRIVAVQGITIYDVLCVDMYHSDSTKVARLVVDVHAKCQPLNQLQTHPEWIDAEGSPWCNYNSENPEPCDGRSVVDWGMYGYDYSKDPDEAEYQIDSTRMLIGGAYFYTVCKDDDPKIQPAPYDSATTYMSHRKIWLDNSVLATEPVCNNGFWGTFKDTTIKEPVTVFTKDFNSGQQFLEQVTSATIPAHRGYFKGYFECVPWRYNTDEKVETNPYPSSAPNPLHYPCTGEIKAAPRLSANAIAFNVGRDATTGLYQVDFEHPIYLGQETNKRIENGQLIIEAADGSIYNAFGQRVK